MKKTNKLIMAAFAFAASIQPCTSQINDWENPQLVNKNSEKPHVILHPYMDAKAALTGDIKNSPFFISLNGNWKFNWVKSPVERPGFF
jgi:beta-galactosidase